jgi:hypothetical protein
MLHHPWRPLTSNSPTLPLHLTIPTPLHLSALPLRGLLRSFIAPVNLIDPSSRQFDPLCNRSPRPFQQWKTPMDSLAQVEMPTDHLSHYLLV